MKKSRSLRLLVAVLGVLSVAGAAVFNVGFVGQTLASWADRAFGATTFRTDPAALQGFAQAVGGRYQIQRAVTGATVSGSVAQSGASGVGTATTPATGFMPSIEGGAFSLVQTLVQSKSCASYLSTSGACAFYGPTPPAIHSVSVAKDLKTQMSATGLNIRFYTDPGEEFKTTASCAPGGSPSASAVQSDSGTMYLGEDSAIRDSTPMTIPTASDAIGTHTSTSGVALWRGVGFDYYAELVHTRSRSSTAASSTLRLRLSSYGDLWPYPHQWTLDQVVVHAGCGIGTPLPGLPSVNAETPVPRATSGPSQTFNPVSATPLAAMMMSEQDEVAVCSTAMEPTRSEAEAAIDERDESATATETIPTGPADTEPGDGKDVPNELEPVDHVTDSATEPIPCEPKVADPTVLSPVDLLVEDGIIGEAEPQPEVESREDEGATDTDLVAESDAGSEEPDDSEGEKPAPGAESDADEEAKDGDDATREPDADRDGADTRADDAPATATPTTTTSTPSAEPAPAPAPAPAPSGPTTPSRVSTAVPFTMVATDGSDLGAATVRDISRTDGCVAVLLDVTTSDRSGTTTLNGLRSNDFREVLDDGNTAPVSSPTGTCTVDISMPTSFGPGATYSGWVTFDVANGGSSVMLRPAGTAGWIITLPPAPPSPAPAPVVTAIPTAVETAPATSTPATTEETAPAEEPVEE